MTNEPSLPTDAREGDGTAGDEPVEPEVHDEIPDHLDLPLEVPEADALEQELDVPIDDEER
jgi:hypothetical protein